MKKTHALGTFDVLASAVLAAQPASAQVFEETVVTATKRESTVHYFTESSIDPAGLQDSWTKLDAYLGVVSADHVWRVTLRDRNLTDEHTSNAYQFFVGNSLAWLAPPRTFTIEAEYRIGQ